MPFRGRILGRNWDKSLKSFPPYYSQFPLPKEFTPPPPPLSKGGLKLVNVNIVHGHLKSENSQVCGQEPQQNCTFVNSASICASIDFKGDAPVLEICCVFS
jgi:hypothetical protein